MRRSKEVIDAAILETKAQARAFPCNAPSSGEILASEVEALRADVERLGKLCASKDQAFMDGLAEIDDGAVVRLAIADERAKVVLYLRRTGYPWIAERIEACDHGRADGLAQDLTRAPTVACDRLTGETARAS